MRTKAINKCTRGKGTLIRSDRFERVLPAETRYTKSWTHQTLSKFDGSNLGMESLNIYPTFEEVVLGERRKLSPNVIKGGYGSVAKYVTTHFWLLREDFVSPLRTGIDAYREHLRRKDKSQFESFDVKIHQRVIFERPAGKPRSAVLLFDPDGRLRRQNADRSKMFMLDALLCFTSDNFETLVFATVSDRDEKLLSKGEIVVKFCEDYDEDACGIYDDDFLMVESQAFFAPYKYVLTTFQYLSEENFPLKKYFIKASKEEFYPQNLKQPSIYIDVQGVNKNYRFDLKNFKQWPTASELGLNASQLDALKIALTRELAVIQGPPGTGKTFMALKITEILVKNKLAINRRTPILVVCMTNHALDQFLVGMLKFTKNLVRIGGQSKREELEDFNFNKMKGARRERMRKLALQDVIGMTTTGAARMRTELNNLGCQIVIVEEAAEVLEAHVVACLSKSLQHLILIGDHKQLRPKVTDFSLEKLNLHVSLFERMVINRKKCCTLQVQHRMAPQISQLIVPLIYDQLTDHRSVFSNPLPKSLCKTVSFVSHNSQESDEKNKSPSKCNKFEAQFLVALSKHLLRQEGYSSDEFAILTTYKGQLNLIKELIRNDRSDLAEELAEVRVATVDDFQGEESNVILLSLVRSNPNGKIGFLATENRVCVALSRAKNALVLVGNMDCLASESQLWYSIKHTLKRQNALFDSLSLRCELHPGRTFEVKSAEDLKRFAPNGGCNQPCGQVLGCGHRCKAVCHLDTPCPKVVCREPCPRLCNAGLHPCRLECHVKCGKNCNVRVKKRLQCGEHTVDIECKKDVRSLACKNPCARKNLMCQMDHKCQKLCHEECGLCEIPVSVEQPCGHSVTKLCLESLPLCEEPCTRKKRGCRSNHLCTKACHEICSTCEEQVIIARACGHNLVKTCHEDIPAEAKCKERCFSKLACGHSSNKKCYQNWSSCKPCLLFSLLNRTILVWKWFRN